MGITRTEDCRFTRRTRKKPFDPFLKRWQSPCRHETLSRYCLPFIAWSATCTARYLRLEVAPFLLGHMPV
jgi:hypothetical protein